MFMPVYNYNLLTVVTSNPTNIKLETKYTLFLESQLLK